MTQQNKGGEREEEIKYDMSLINWSFNNNTSSIISIEKY